jgi:hypothetical protein
MYQNRTMPPAVNVDIFDYQLIAMAASPLSAKIKY